MADESFKIEGLAELQGRLEELGAIAGQKVLASAARAAMKPVLTAAQQMVPVRTGRLKRSMQLAAVKPKSGDVVVSAGIRMRKKVKEGALFYETGETDDEGEAEVETLNLTGGGAGWRWHFIEFGVPSRGIPAHPFLRPAFSAKVSEVVEKLRASLEKKVKQAIKKAAKAGKR